MPTHLIIDGYNLIGRTGSLPGHLEIAREALLRDLSAYRHRKNHAITVVFDGWQHGQASEHWERQAGVSVIYSKRGERADQVIQRLTREYGETCAVVSSDSEIIGTARAQGALVIKAEEFAQKLRSPSTGSGMVPHKELDMGEDDRSRRTPDKKGNPRKLPKSQRQRNRQLKRF